MCGGWGGPPLLTAVLSRLLMNSVILVQVLAIPRSVHLDELKKDQRWNREFSSLSRCVLEGKQMELGIAVSTSVFLARDCILEALGLTVCGGVNGKHTVHIFCVVHRAATGRG